MHSSANVLLFPLHWQTALGEIDKLGYWHTRAFAIKLKVKAVAVQAMKVHTGVDMYLHSFPISVQDGGDWLTSLPGRFNPRKQPSYPLNRKLCSPHSQYEQFAPAGIRAQDRPALSLVAVPDTPYSP
jgi:hypothetical protein